MPIQNKKINCFISSSSEDLNIAHEISYFLEKEGIAAVTWNSQTFALGLSLLENLQAVIAKSDFVIFIIPSDMSLKDRKRENIFFEMGVIVGMGKPLLTLVPVDTRLELPSDLSSMLYLRYDPRDKENIFRHIRNWAVHSLKDSI